MEVTNDKGPRKLYRSRQNVIGGVCGGLGDYFDLDPVLVRVIFLALMFFGAGFLAYILFWIIVPMEPAYNHDNRR